MAGRVGVPGRARARLEGDQAAGCRNAALGRPDRIDPHAAGEVRLRAGLRCLLASAGDDLLAGMRGRQRRGAKGEHEDGSIHGVGSCVEGSA